MSHNVPGLDNKGPRVVDDYLEEMIRRRESGERRRRRDTPQGIAAFALLAVGLWPLGLVHLTITMVAIGWLFWVSEGSAGDVADELDLLEQKIARRFRLLEERVRPLEDRLGHSETVEH